MLSMLKLRALKRLVTLKSTPGLFSTRADTMCHDSFWTVVANNFPSRSYNHVFETCARCYKWVDVFVRVNRDVYYRCYIRLERCFDSFLKLMHRLRSYALSAIRVGYLDIVRAIVLMYSAVASVVKCALPLGHHSKHIVVHEEYYYWELVKHRHCK